MAISHNFHCKDENTFLGLHYLLLASPVAHITCATKMSEHLTKRCFKGHEIKGVFGKHLIIVIGISLVIISAITQGL